MSGPEVLDLGLNGKGAFVTGATGGIGREVVIALAAAGAHVAVVDLDQAECERFLSELPDPGSHLAIGADLTDVRRHESLLRQTQTAFGRLDVLVCLAAIQRRRMSIFEVTEDDWDAQFAINLKATFFINQAMAALLRAAGNGGRIINFSSQGWWTGGFGGSVVYCATKGGIVSMSRGLARALAPDGITVNTIAPGATDTSMMRTGMTDEALADFVKMIPLGRMAQPSEMAGTVVYLASDLASYVSGATINVSGAQLMY
jgi:NAD(P)-dependent dehydrogenase (short-subunit alcohol dehydrogenase family)